MAGHVCPGYARGAGSVLVGRAVPGRSASSGSSSTTATSLAAQGCHSVEAGEVLVLFYNDQVRWPEPTSCTAVHASSRGRTVTILRPLAVMVPPDAPQFIVDYILDLSGDGALSAEDLERQRAAAEAARKVAELQMERQRQDVKLGQAECFKAAVTHLYNCLQV